MDLEFILRSPVWDGPQAILFPNASYPWEIIEDDTAACLQGNQSEPVQMSQL